jgi:O-antigen/teichoic acid export membrane protein
MNVEKTNISFELVKHSTIYGLGEFFSKSLGFILIPIYTRYFASSEYGELQILLITYQLVSIFIQSGIGSALFKSILHSEHSNDNVIYSTAFYYLISWATLFLLPFLLFSDHIASHIWEDVKDLKIFYTLLLLIWVKNIYVLPYSKLRIENKSITFIALHFSQFLLQMLFTIYLVVYVKLGIWGVILGESLSLILLIPWIFIIMKDSIKWTFSKFELKEMLKFGIPLVPAALAMFILNASDRYFLKTFSTLYEVGIYSLGYKLGIIIGLIVYAFQQSWASSMFHIAKMPNASEIFAKIFIYFYAFLVIIATGMTVFAKELVSFIADASYLSCYKIIPFVSYSYLFLGVYYYSAVGINIKKKTYIQPFIVGLAAILNLVLNYILIPGRGMFGAAWSTLISFIIMGSFALIISNRYYFIYYKISKILLISAVPVFMIFLIPRVSVVNIFTTVIVKLFLYLISILIILCIIDKRGKFNIKFIKDIIRS